MRALGSLLRNRLTRAVKRRIVGSATLEVMAELGRRGINLLEIDALEVFGGTGELHTADYACLVKSLTVWEIDPSLEAMLRRNLPGARIKITDSFEEMRVTSTKFGLVVLDNAIFTSETKLCEHFDFFPLVFRVLNDRAVIMMDVIPGVSPRFRSEFPYVFNPYHLRRRCDFYGTATPETIAIDDMVPTYESFARDAGFRLDWHFSKKRGKSDLYFLVLGLTRFPQQGNQTSQASCAQ